MTGRSRPTVSLGMPAYNSERTIRAAIDCLLQQDLQDFELIISDNASTDGTWAIVEQYAARDPRIVALRQPRNIGANGNYSAVVQAARGTYFKWASSNDWCSPQMLSHCVAYLQAHPDTVLVAPRTRIFVADINDATDYEGDVAFDHPEPVQRFMDVGTKLKLNNVLNGVVRTRALKSTRLIEHYRDSDVVLVGHLALLGKIALLDEFLFGRRMSPETATQLMSEEDRQRHHYPVKTLRAIFPTWRYVVGWGRAVLATELPLAAKARALRRVGMLLYWSRGHLQRDLADALRYPLRG